MATGGKQNYNSTASAGSSAQVCAANASRTKFTFKSNGAAFVLNFGATATSANVLPVNPNETISLTNRDEFDIRKQINVYCVTASDFTAQAEEMTVN